MKAEEQTVNPVFSHVIWDGVCVCMCKGQGCYKERNMFDKVKIRYSVSILLGS